MTYTELKEFFTTFHLGLISKKELACAIGMWQRHVQVEPTAPKHNYFVIR